MQYTLVYSTSLYLLPILYLLIILENSSYKFWTDHKIDINIFCSQFNLGCQEWKRALVGTVHNSGMFLAMLFTGAISDRFGRKVAVGMAACASFTFGFSRAFAPGYLTYLALHFMEAAIGGGLYPSAYVMGTFFTL